MNSREQLELIEIVFDRVEKNTWGQASFQFDGLAPDGEVRTFSLNELYGNRNVCESFLYCLKNPKTLCLLELRINKWIEIYNTYLFLFDVWKKIKADNLNIEIVREIIRKNKHKFQARKKVLDGIQDFETLHEILQKYGDDLLVSIEDFGLDLYFRIANVKQNKDRQDRTYKDLIRKIFKLMEYITFVREIHWQLRSKALQEVIDGKILKIDPEQFQVMKKLEKKLEQQSNKSKHPLWLSTAIEEGLLNDSGVGYYYLTKDNVRAFWNVLFNELEIIYENREDPRGMAIDQMPDLKVAQQLVKRKNGKPYSLETFRKAKKKL